MQIQRLMKKITDQLEKVNGLKHSLEKVEQLDQLQKEMD